MRETISLDTARAMLSELAHALNNPLGSIVLAASLLRDDPPAELVAELAETIEHEALRAGELLTDLRILSSRVDEQELVSVDLVPLLAGLGVRQVDAPGVPVAVRGVPARLELVLRRLIGLVQDDAASLTAEIVRGDGSVAVRLGRERAGSEMPVSGGADLRLRTARIVAAESGGTINLVRTASWSGWELCFPLAEVRQRVLVLDDSASLGSMFSLLLERAGWTVDVSDDPADVEHLLSVHRPDAALVDLHLGSASGLDVADQIERSAPDLAGRIAIVTGDRFADLGGRPVLYKPFRAAELNALLEQLTAGSPT